VPLVSRRARDRPEKPSLDTLSNIQHWPLPALAAIVAGVVVLVAPRVLNYAVAAYLLLVGAFGLLSALRGTGASTQAVIALVAGLLILVKPQILSYVVGIYLILAGLLQAGIFGL
jgi:hypothetical protein